MINLEDVGKRYQGRNFDVHALSGVNITPPAGQFVSVVGRSGSGKSTLLKILGLLDFDHSGSYTFGGKQFTEASDRDVSRARSRIGYVFGLSCRFRGWLSAPEVAHAVLASRFLSCQATGTWGRRTACVMSACGVPCWASRRR